MIFCFSSTDVTGGMFFSTFVSSQISGVSDSILGTIFFVFQVLSSGEMFAVSGFVSIFSSISSKFLSCLIGEEVVLSLFSGASILFSGTFTSDKISFSERAFTSSSGFLSLGSNGADMYFCLSNNLYNISIYFPNIIEITLTIIIKVNQYYWLFIIYIIIFILNIIY